MYACSGGIWPAGYAKRTLGSFIILLALNIQARVNIILQKAFNVRNNNFIAKLMSDYPVAAVL